jgi:DNA-binding NarL/FixJ family response regulator
MGYKVTTANNGSAGLDRLVEGYAKGDFDIVLMDLQMPVMVCLIYTCVYIYVYTCISVRVLRRTYIYINIYVYSYV